MHFVVLTAFFASSIFASNYNFKPSQVKFIVDSCDSLSAFLGISTNGLSNRYTRAKKVLQHFDSAKTIVKADRGAVEKELQAETTKFTSFVELDAIDTINNAFKWMSSYQRISKYNGFDTNTSVRKKILPFIFLSKSLGLSVDEVATYLSAFYYSVNLIGDFSLAFSRTNLFQISSYLANGGKLEYLRQQLFEYNRLDDSDYLRGHDNKLNHTTLGYIMAQVVNGKNARDIYREMSILRTSIRQQYPWLSKKEAQKHAEILLTMDFSDGTAIGFYSELLKVLKFDPTKPRQTSQRVVSILGTIESYEKHTSKKLNYSLLVKALALKESEYINMHDGWALSYVMGSRRRYLMKVVEQTNSGEISPLTYIDEQDYKRYLKDISTDTVTQDSRRRRIRSAIVPVRESDWFTPFSPF